MIVNWNLEEPVHANNNESVIRAFMVSAQGPDNQVDHQPSDKRFDPETGVAEALTNIGFPAEKSLALARAAFRSGSFQLPEDLRAWWLGLETEDRRKLASDVVISADKSRTPDRLIRIELAIVGASLLDAEGKYYSMAGAGAIGRLAVELIGSGNAAAAAQLWEGYREGLSRIETPSEEVWVASGVAYSAAIKALDQVDKAREVLNEVRAFIANVPLERSFSLNTCAGLGCLSYSIPEEAEGFFLEVLRAGSPAPFFWQTAFTQILSLKVDNSQTSDEDTYAFRTTLSELPPDVKEFFSDSFRNERYMTMCTREADNLEDLEKWKRTTLLGFSILGDTVPDDHERDSTGMLMSYIFARDEAGAGDFLLKRMETKGPDAVFETLYNAFFQFQNVQDAGVIPLLAKVSGESLAKHACIESSFTFENCLEAVRRFGRKEDLCVFIESWAVAAFGDKPGADSHVIQTLQRLFDLARANSYQEAVENVCRTAIVYFESAGMIQQSVELRLTLADMLQDRDAGAAEVKLQIEEGEAFLRKCHSAAISNRLTSARVERLRGLVEQDPDIQRAHLEKALALFGDSKHFGYEQADLLMHLGKFFSSSDMADTLVRSQERERIAARIQALLDGARLGGTVVSLVMLEARANLLWQEGREAEARQIEQRLKNHHDREVPVSTVKVTNLDSSKTNRYIVSPQPVYGDLEFDELLPMVPVEGAQSAPDIVFSLTGLQLSKAELRRKYEELACGDRFLVAIDALLKEGGKKEQYNALFLLEVLLDSETRWQRPQYAAAAMHYLVSMAASEMEVSASAQSLLDNYLSNGEAGAAQLLFSLFAEDSQTAGTRRGFPSVEREGVLKCLLSSNRSFSQYTGLRLLLAPGFVNESRKRYWLEVSSGHHRLRPYFSRYLRQMSESASSGELEQLSGYISGVCSWAGDYFGERIFTFYERGLRLMDRQYRGNIPLAHRNFAPHMPAHLFPFVHSMTNGNSRLIQALDRLYAETQETREGARTAAKKEPPEMSSHFAAFSDLFDWHLRELRHSIIRVAFMPEELRSRLCEGLMSLLETPDYGRRMTTLHQTLSQARDSMEKAAELVNPYYTGLLTDHIQLHSFKGPSFQLMLDRMAREGAEIMRTDPLLVRSYLKRDPTEWALGRKSAPEERLHLELESGDSLPVAEVLSRFGVDHQKIMRLYAHYRTLRPFFMFTHSLANLSEPECMGFWGAILGNWDPENPHYFRSWRYNLTNPVVQQQLAPLDSNQLRAWISGDRTRLLHSTQLRGPGWLVPGSKGEPGQMMLVSDDPYLLLNSGKVPLGTGACTGYDQPAYYSRNLLSYIADAHTKVCLTVDLKYVANSAPEIIRELPDAAEMMTHLWRQPWLLLNSISSRTILRIVADEDDQPALIMQPTFLYMSRRKNQAPEELRNAIRTYAEELEVPLVRKPGPGDKTRVYRVPATWSPGGQVENYDGLVWLASHRQSYLVRGTPEASG